MMAPDAGSLRFDLPHGDRARFVTRVIHQGRGNIRCEGSVPAGGPYGRAGRCPSFVLIELAAQAAAALQSLEQRDGPATGSPAGLLVRAWNVRSNRRDIAEGRMFQASVRRTRSAPPLMVYEMSIVDASGEEILSGEFGIYNRVA